MKVLEFFKTGKKIDGSQCEAAIAANAIEVKSIETKIADLESRKASVLVDVGETAFDKIEAEIEQLRKRLGKLATADEEMQKRLAAARAAEQDEAAEALATKARSEVYKALVLALRDYHESAIGLLASVEKVASLDGELQRLNATLKAAGRSDLMTDPPWVAIHGQLVRFAKEEGYAFPISEKWQTVATEEGIEAVPAEFWIGVPPYPTAPDLRKIQIPDYCENGVVRWQQPFRFV